MQNLYVVKFMFSKKATKIDEIFTVNLTLCSKRQIDGEDFVNSRGLLRKYQLYLTIFVSKHIESIINWYVLEHITAYTYT